MSDDQGEKYDLGLAKTAITISGHARARRASRFTLDPWLQTGVRVGNTLAGSK